jgi:YD repeat-containing protein
VKLVVLAVALGVGLVAAGCGYFRSNPQLTSVVDDARGTTSLSYDDSRRVQNVDDGLNARAFAFSAGHVSAMTTTSDKPGATTEPVETDFTFTGGQLTASSADFGHGQILNVAVTYDGNGRISTVTTANTQDGQAVTTSSVALAYGGDGLSIIKSTADDGTETDVAVAYDKNGNVASLTAADANGQTSSTTTAAYKANRLTTLTTTPTGGQAKTTTFAYDKQGRITNATTKTAGASDSVISLVYVDGEATEIDVTPNDLFPAALWDLGGGSHNAFDAHTQVPRFAGASW